MLSAATLPLVAQAPGIGQRNCKHCKNKKQGMLKTNSPDSPPLC